MEIESKTLLNNKIDQFILRIDLTPDAMVDFKQLAEKLTSDYGDARTELHVNYNIDMQKVEVKKEEFLKYIMGKAPQITLTLDSFERSIVLESNHYDNNSVYKQRLSKIIALIKEMQPESSALRIGMRYINKFPCLKSSEISKYFNSSEANNIKNTLQRSNISRAMLVHEYQFGDYQARIQCGIPNKYYPSVISNYELILDIDVFGLGVQGIDEWENSIRDYNHGAYDMFIRYIKPSLLEDLR